MPSFPNILININGVLAAPEEARISVFDRGFLYGDSVYEVTQTIRGIPFRLDLHLERLRKSASKIGLSILTTDLELKKQIARTLIALDEPTVYLRLVVTRGGEEEISLDPNTPGRENIVIIAKELKPYPIEWYEKGVRVIIADTIRNPLESIDPNVKSGNYLNNVMAFGEASKIGAYDAIMLNHHGEVTEATTSNVWMIKDGTIYTPPLRSGLLEGLTRKALLQISQHAKIPVFEKTITPQELFEADEIFLSSTTKKLIPITTLNEKKIGTGLPGPLTQQLRQLYDQHCEHTLKSFEPEWREILGLLG
jgi:branched-chain amino acid aminotransferase